MFIKYSNQLIEALHKCDSDEWDHAIDLVSNAYDENRQVFTCGNGGSANTASHYIVDWNKMTLHYNSKALKGICLSDNIGTITAYANDYDYKSIYAEQLKFYAQKGDLLIVISGSGNSQNILEALNAANQLGLNTIAIVGFDGGSAVNIAKHKVHVPIGDMQIVEDLHLSFGHMVMKKLCDQTNFGKL
jgi:D-sedoheptulose 7-phosphate isomerase